MQQLHGQVYVTMVIALVCIAGLNATSSDRWLAVQCFNDYTALPETVKRLGELQCTVC